MVPFFDVMKMTRDEGKAAVMIGLPKDICPYKISENSREQELRGYWLSGYAEGRQILLTAITPAIVLQRSRTLLPSLPDSTLIL